MLSKALLSKHLNEIGVHLDGQGPADIRIHDNRLYAYMAFNPSLAMGEGYVKGWWDCDHLDDLFYRAGRQKLEEKFYVSWRLFFSALINRLFNFQTRRKAHEVAEKHYNLGNQFYRQMLGETMAYTCGYWKNASNLDEAQYHKFDLICRKLKLQPGESVLDLGCGWGTLAKYMAEKYQCNVTAVNLSSEQVAYGREVCKGLPIKFFQCDYRDAATYNPQKIPFDKIASVGLCEHVGYKNYRFLMQLAKENLKDNGLFLLHTIGKNDSTPYCDTWIDKYIFPNGMLPSIKLLAKAAEGIFITEDLHNFGADYDKTLMAWYHNFKAQGESARDERFRRLWTYYLLTCAGGFRARGMELWQFVLSPNGVLGGYESVR